MKINKITVIYIVFIFLFSFFSGCKYALCKQPIIMACTVNGKLRILALSPLSDLKGKTEKKQAVQKVSTFSCKNLKYYWDSGNNDSGEPAQVIFFKSDSVPATPFGRKMYHSVLFNGKHVKVMAFQQYGECFMFVIDGIIYKDVQGKAVQTGRAEFRTYRLAAGEQRRALMCKYTGRNEKWCFESDNRVYQQKNNGEIVQTGWMQWRNVILPEGSKILIIMTKGMEKNAKWSGRYNGKCYIDESG